MGPNPLRPLAPDKFDYWKAHHLLNRAGFGGTPAQVRSLANLGLNKAVDTFVESLGTGDSPPPPTWDKDFMRPPTADERQAEQAARRANDEAALERMQKERQRREQLDREQMREGQTWWLTRMIETGRPLEEKMTLFWHGHFATGYRTIEDSYHMLVQNQLFRSHAVGNFLELVYAIIRDPAMLEYLDNDENRRQRPNENLARELMELFVLGEGNGYTEQDIKEGARALTGLTFVDDDFVFRDDDHDSAPKTLFGKRGPWNGNDFVKLMLEKPVASEFVCWKLFRFFVNDAPGAPSDDGQTFVRGLAKQFRDGGYELRPILRTMFRSEFFYSPNNSAAVIKSPIQLIVQALRSYRTPVRSMPALVSAADLMGQNLFQPPNVKGWDGGRAWINTATLFVRQNLLIYLLTGRRPQQYDWPASDEHYDATHLLDDLTASAGDDPPSADDIARFLLRFSLAAKPHPDRVEALRRFLADTASAPTNDRLIGALALITAMPEYQLC